MRAEGWLLDELSLDCAGTGDALVRYSKGVKSVLRQEPKNLASC